MSVQPGMHTVYLTNLWWGCKKVYFVISTASSNRHPAELFRIIKVLLVALDNPKSLLWPICKTFGRWNHVHVISYSTFDRVSGASFGPIMSQCFQFWRPEDMDTLLVADQSAPLDPFPSWLLELAELSISVKWLSTFLSGSLCCQLLKEAVDTLFWGTKSVKYYFHRK